MVVSSFLVIDGYSDITLKLALTRLTGTIGGVLLGVIVASVFNQYNLISIIIAFTVIGSVGGSCYFYNRNFRHVAATASILYVLCLYGFSHPYTIENWEQGAARLISIVLGILIPTIVTLILLPEKSEQSTELVSKTVKHEPGKVMIPIHFMLKMSISGSVVGLIVCIFQINFIGWIWMILSIYMVLDIDHNKSVRAGIDRVVTAIVGTFLGYMMAVLFAGQGYLAAAIALFIIGVVAGAASYVAKFWRFLGLQGAVIFTMAEFPEMHMGYWRMAFERSMTTIIAVVVLLLISTLFVSSSRRQGEPS